MEKKKLTQEMLDKRDPHAKDPLSDLGFCIIDKPLPYAELEQAAMELIDNVLIMDRTGVWYENYSYDVERCYVMLKYCTDMDVDGWDKKLLYQMFGTTIDAAHYEDHCNIERIEHMYDRMKIIATKRHEVEHSLSYKICQLIDLLTRQGSSDSREMAERLINLIGKVKETDGLPSAPVLTMFAKKN